VKIDLSLVQGGVLRDPAIAVLRGIQSMAAQSNASVVAEGIETVEQLEAIRRLSIPSGQGYLLAVPAPHATSLRIDVDLLVESHRARRHAILESWELPQDVAAWGISGDRVALRPAPPREKSSTPPTAKELTPIEKRSASSQLPRKPRAARTSATAKVSRTPSPAKVRRPRPAA
jgi:hypothetical protein